MSNFSSNSWNLSGVFREWFEDNLAAGLRGVRIGFGAAPRRYDARAFANGERVVLLPETACGDGRSLIPLLAHELTHVVQQRRLARAARQPRPGLLCDRDLEAEAQAWERYAARHNPLPAGLDALALFAPVIDPLPPPRGGLIQCASSGYGVLPKAGAKLPGGVQYFQEEKLKKSFREAVEQYVRLVAPGDVGVESWEPPAAARKRYVDVLYRRIQSKPYLLKELVGDKKVAFDDLPAADQRWVRDELYRAWDKLRIDRENMQVTGRIRLGHMASWMDFRAVDCVFAAILRTLIELTDARVDTSRIKGKDPATVVTESEAKEAEMEAWLADHFHVARSVTPDVQIIQLLESDLGWKNMSAVATFADLKTASYRGKAYIVSYERTPGTETKDAFWHTVYVEINSSGKAKITDRQATGMGSSGSIPDSAKCDAWKIDPGTSGFQALKKAFDREFS
jgi:hypothetical protein